MFERILEKILIAKLGKFIVGLDREQLKVAVWRGDIILENVILKPDIFKILQMPLVLKYGTVACLSIKIPWTKLASEPVEIILQGLYVVISPQEKSDWDYSESGNIMKRKDYIQVLEQRKQKSQEKKTLNAEEELKKKSYIERLSAKVIDNLKVKIQDIHIRFEYHIENSHFSAGITLEKIDCYTTNQYWNNEFTDRQQSGSANLAIYKLVHIIGLHFYWTCDDLAIVNIADPLIMLNFLRNKVYEQNPYDSIVSPSNF